jgi:ubiquinone/menaquinone biosynthesis C-methylase UbiE
VSNENRLIEINRSIYDAIAPLYEGQHSEIFNPTEQGRIRKLLGFCLSQLDCSLTNPQILDFGSGTGNLTRHLLELGAFVVAADISKGCLKQLETVIGRQERLKTLQLNGSSLSNISSSSFDMVATYSVLHHIPDYIRIVKEFVRIVKPGGLIYIDHEHSPSYWNSQEIYKKYTDQLDFHAVEIHETVSQRLRRVFSRKGVYAYLRAVWWIIRNRSKGEGDIHVHPNDHINWSAIRSCLEPYCDILMEEDYLVCRERGLEASVWKLWHKRCVDMRVMVAVKKIS